ncbi:MAG: hypothetical protein M1836_004488 [Candelina mexicana]|nr:MAG: hypothetical protein M1836_004488 [Candelina mexicana]
MQFSNSHVFLGMNFIILATVAAALSIYVTNENRIVTARTHGANWGPRLSGSDLRERELVQNEANFKALTRQVTTESSTFVYCQADKDGVRKRADDAVPSNGCGCLPLTKVILNSVLFGVGKAMVGLGRCMKGCGNCLNRCCTVNGRPVGSANAALAAGGAAGAAGVVAAAGAAAFVGGVGRRALVQRDGSIAGGFSPSTPAVRSTEATESSSISSAHHHLFRNGGKYKRAEDSFLGVGSGYKVLKDVVLSGLVLVIGKVTKGLGSGVGAPGVTSGESAPRRGLDEEGKAKGPHQVFATRVI